jgi:hypothetical protein
MSGFCMLFCAKSGCRDQRCSVMLQGLQAGAFFDGLRMVPQPLPFGCKPRLILIHACSEAVKTRRREIGHSVRGFLRQLDKEIGVPSADGGAGVDSHDHRLETPNGPETIQAPPVDRFRARMPGDEAAHAVAGCPTPRWAFLRDPDRTRRSRRP